MESTINKPQQAKMETLSFSGILREIISDLSKRSQEIIFIRYGIFNSGSSTLEEIGKKYGITRERVRQIIHEVLKKVREKKDDPFFVRIQDEIILAIRSNSGIMEEKKLVSQLGNGNENEKAAVRFFLECIKGINFRETKGELKASYASEDFDPKKWQSVKDEIVEILKQRKKTLSLEELHGFICKNETFSDLSENMLLDYMEVSEEIGKNSFGKWGISKWKEISPKGTREKAYLVLKEAGNPLHFREIAKKIDEYSLNKKKTHPQTVHNELIKDKNFVLVGRGIYALVEWGYKKGTVKDVIEEIVNGSKKALDRNEILEKVLKIRQVKKSTIVINLNNYFIRSKNGTYSIKK